MPTLTIITDQGKGARYVLDEGEYSIGRGHNNFICLADDGVSEHHASIVVDGVEVRIQDLESVNGTHVSDRRIDKCTLLGGEIIRIGLTVFEYENSVLKHDSEKDNISASQTIVLSRSASDIEKILREPTSDGAPVISSHGAQAICSIADRLADDSDFSVRLNDSLSILKNYFAATSGFVGRPVDGLIEFLCAFPANNPRGTIPVSSSLIRSVLDKGIGVIIEDTTSENRNASSSLRDLGKQSVIYAPLRASNRIAAVIGLSRDSARPFTDNDLNLVVLAAKLMGVALFADTNLYAREVEQKAYSQRDRQQSLIIGESAAMAEAFAVLDKVAATEATVLILGETGTGKELFARALHARSTRNSAALVSVNCGSFTENLVESELFGHMAGAFTSAHKAHRGIFEQAEGGTVFLDEVAELSLNAQVKLLRALEERLVRRVGADHEIPVNFRLIVATNRNLQKLVLEGKFRNDLFHRLNVIPIQIPPLRERSDDISLLADHFFEKSKALNGREGLLLTDSAIEKLRDYPWPGNVRELRHAIERVVILSENDRIDASSFAFLTDPISGLDDSPNRAMIHQEAVCENIYRALEQEDWKIGRAAEFLKIDRGTLKSHCKKCGIDLETKR